jgi:hypothetical protein
VTCTYASPASVGIHQILPCTHVIVAKATIEEDDHLSESDDRRDL